jgi:hypothetical protein
VHPGRHLVLAGAFLAGLALNGMAQMPVAPSPVETVIVTAHAKGPVVWHATKQGADVAILGIVQPLPDDFAWNAKPFAAILSSARLVLLPPRIQMGLFSGAWFYLTKSDLLHPPQGRTLWDILDSNVAAELARVCDVLHEPKDRYSDNAPIPAAMRLGSDYRHVAFLTTHEPEDAIRTMARAQHVTVRTIATYDMIPSGEDLLNLPPAMTGTCIDAEIRDIDFQRVHASAAANAWATGDVASVLANWSPSQFYACLVRLSPHATQIDARAIDDTVQAIEAAIAGGGRTVAVIDIGILLRKDGVLARLKGAGVSITCP